MMFTTRRNQGKQTREQAAKEAEGAKKAEWERKAEWFEAHSPKEANQ
jgi:hypothetical protein